MLACFQQTLRHDPRMPARYEHVYCLLPTRCRYASAYLVPSSTGTIASECFSTHVIASYSGLFGAFPSAMMTGTASAFNQGDPYRVYNDGAVLVWYLICISL